MIQRKAKQKPIAIKLPENSFDRAEKADRELVAQINEIVVAQYTPQEPIKGLKIVL